MMPEPERAGEKIETIEKTEVVAAPVTTDASQAKDRVETTTTTTKTEEN